jgi:hypothetical protein
MEPLVPAGAAIAGRILRAALQNLLETLRYS